MLKIVDIYNKLTDESRSYKKYPDLKVLPDEVAPEVGQIKLTKLNYRMYSSILFIMDSYNRIRAPKSPSVVTISTNGFLRMYFAISTISKYLEEMERLGVIKKYTSHYYEHDDYTPLSSYAKRYIWFPQNEMAFRNFCKENNIDSRSFERTMNEKYARKGATIYNSNLVKFTSKTKITKPAGFNCYDMYHAICEQLKDTYPLLPIFQKKVDCINKKYYEHKPERIISYTPSVKFNDYFNGVTKIGIRYNCDFCTYPKEPKEGFTHRSDYLEQEGLDLHYDVKGSIPKISVLINREEFSDNNNDPYKDMYDEYVKLSGESGDFDYETRNCFKYMFVRAYFECGFKSFTYHVFSNLTNKGYQTSWNEKVENDGILLDLDEAVTNCCGKSLGSEIFFHESNVYILVLEHLLSNGFDVVTCFDSFYAHKDGVSQEKFDTYMNKIVKKCAMKYLKMLKKTPTVEIDKTNSVCFMKFIKSKKMTHPCGWSLMRYLGVLDGNNCPTGNYKSLFFRIDTDSKSLYLTNEGKSVISKLIDDNLDKVELIDNQYRFKKEFKDAKGVKTPLPCVKRRRENYLNRAERIAKWNKK